MKHLKISLIAVIAIVLGIGGSAFKARPTNTERGWFKLINALAPADAASYEYYGAASPCGGYETLCGIMGDRNENPEILTPSQDDVDTAKSASDDFDHPVTDLVEFEE